MTFTCSEKNVAFINQLHATIKKVYAENKKKTNNNKH